MYYEGGIGSSTDFLRWATKTYSCSHTNADKRLSYKSQGKAGNVKLLRLNPLEFLNKLS